MIKIWNKKKIKKLLQINKKEKKMILNKNKN